MLLLLTFFFFDPAHAQQRFERPLRSLPQVAISTGVSLHIVSPEPIQKVDVSSQAISGDLLEKNVLRLIVIPDSAYLLLRQASSTVVVSIIGESYIAQYNLCFVPAGLGEVPALINIQPEHCQSLDVAGIGLSTLIMKSKALEMLAKQSSQPIRKAKAMGWKRG